VTGMWRKPHNEELHDLCSSPIIIRKIMSRRMDRVGSRNWNKRNLYTWESQRERGY
jgi:hypothetical protein